MITSLGKYPKTWTTSLSLNLAIDLMSSLDLIITLETKNIQPPWFTGMNVTSSVSDKLLYLLGFYPIA